MKKLLILPILLASTLFAEQVKKPVFFDLPQRPCNLPAAVGQQQGVRNVINLTPNAPLQAQVPAAALIRGIDFSKHPKNPSFNHYIVASIPGLGVLVGADALVKLVDGPLKTKKWDVGYDVRKEFRSHVSRAPHETRIIINGVLMFHPTYYNLREEEAKRYIEHIDITNAEKAKFFVSNTALVAFSVVTTRFWLNYFAKK